jgi:hypothetical protein
LSSFKLSSLFSGYFFLTWGCSETPEKEKKKAKSFFLGTYQWLECFLVWNVPEGDGSIRAAVACRIHQTMVGQGGHLSVYTQAAMKPIMPLPLQWYVSPSLSDSDPLPFSFTHLCFLLFGVTDIV